MTREQWVELAPALWTLLMALVCGGLAGWFTFARDWVLAVAMVFWALYLAFTALRMAGLVSIEAVDEDWPG